MSSVSKLCHEPLLSQKSPLQRYHMNLPTFKHLKFLAIFLLILFLSFLTIVKYDLYFHIILSLCIILSYFIIYFHNVFKHPKIFLVDFSCFKPPNALRVPHSAFIENVHLLKNFDNESVEFMSKMLKFSGQGPMTYLPPSLHYIPPKATHYNSIDEAKMVFFPIMEDLLNKSNISPLDIDILVVNCSGFCPSPSLASIIVNKFKLRSNVKAFNLSGMGCSASMVSMGLAQNLLLVHKESNAVILSTEILSTGWYKGQDRPKLLLNCIFRMGGAAILLSNKKEAKYKAKYQVKLMSRAQRAFNDRSYKSAQREEDSNGLTGVSLDKDILEVVSDVLQDQLKALGSLILPTLEKLKFVTSLMQNKYWNNSIKIYVPNFKSIINHFCLPISGKPLIRGVGKGLHLEEKDMEAALATLHRFGNQSSSSLWYELAYLEAKERVMKGEKVLMLGLGSGLKCTCVVLECKRPIVGESNKGPWAECIDKYPTLAFTN